MKLSLVVQTPGPNRGKILEIKLPQFVVGRDPQCHLRPVSPMISKRHCAVLQRDDKAFVRDFGSTNGTFVNDEPVKGEVELHDGDRLKMGPLLFDVKLEVAAPVNHPTPAPASKPAAKVGAPAPSSDGKAAAARKPAPAVAAADTQTEIPAAKADTQTEDADESSGSSDEDIAAMLLSVHDEGDSPNLSGGITDVPEGSTIHEMPLPPELAAQMAREKEKAKQATPGNTSQAAKSILEKYMKRPRPQ
jgi:pSer/pThr/pTyr-binding forkhead associated (FHA) protein